MARQWTISTQSGVVRKSVNDEGESDGDDK